MTMNKKTKTAIAVGVVGIAAYLLYRQSQKNKPFANFTRMRASTLEAAPTGLKIVEKCMRSPDDAAANPINIGGKIYYACCGTMGQISQNMGTQPCPNGSKAIETVAKL